MPIAGSSLAGPTPIASLLQRELQSRPDDLALVSSDASYSWRELDDLSSRLAAHYLAMGLSPGDRVASLMPNRPALVIHYLACLKAGLAATPLNYRYMPPEIDHALAVSGAVMLLAHAERDADLASSQLAGGLAKGIVRYGASDGRGPRYEELIAGPQPSTALSPPDVDVPAFIYFTSGSTGKPKGVTHTHRTFGWVMASIIAGMEITAADRVLPGSSFSHAGGSMVGLATLAAGARLVVPRTSEGHILLPLLREHRPTVLFMLPAALIALVREHGATKDDFASIRLCSSGGDKVPGELEREYTELTGLAIDEDYGMTEIGLATINPVSGENRLGSVGRPCPGFVMAIRDDAGAELTAGTAGRLWVRSGSNMIGYWNNPAATAATIVDGWLDTGDVMRADPEGYLWFEGRKKQIIIHDGSNICPQEIEEALLEHPAVEAAGVVGIHNLVHGENVRAYVTLKAAARDSSGERGGGLSGGGRVTGAELIQFARARVGYKAPEEIVFLDSMPLNATGKVDRVTLKRMVEERIVA